MSPPPVFINKISQKDNYTFTIEWSDGIIGGYRLNILQKNCPCAKCNDEMTGQRRVSEEVLQEDVRALRISSVGRYALRIQFTSGCSAGIFSYELLRGLSKQLEP